MQRIKLGELEKHIGKKVIVKGFLHELRNQSKVKFLLLRDVSGIRQCVSLQGEESFESISKLTKESVLKIEGVVKKEKQAPGGIELQIKEIKVLSQADPKLPISVVEKKGEAALPSRLDYRWIDLRKPKNAMIFKIWTFMEAAMREY